MAYKEKPNRNTRTSPPPKKKKTAKFKLTLTESNYEAMSGVCGSLYEVKRWFNSMGLAFIPSCSAQPVINPLFLNNKKKRTKLRFSSLSAVYTILY